MSEVACFCMLLHDSFDKRADSVLSCESCHVLLLILEGPLTTKSRMTRVVVSPPKLLLPNLTPALLQRWKLRSKKYYFSLFLLFRLFFVSPFFPWPRPLSKPNASSFHNTLQPPHSSPPTLILPDPRLLARKPLTPSLLIGSFFRPLFLRSPLSTHQPARGSTPRLAPRASQSWC